ncbi:hypothetical protein F5883DRAFT_68264 [Diaporthe sp. PMI_573]|nr:hypothetical protein F5883DRAFT_68264 [Diaporthaceae sp. PMI_573]
MKSRCPWLFLISSKGTFDLERNICSNQFNVALNIGAARFVLSKHKEFERFVVVPSDSTLKVKYPLEALSGSNQHLAKRFLAFNCRVDIMKLRADGTTNDIAGKRAAVPDLTAFLCAFSPRFPGVTLGRASLVDENGRLTLKRSDSGDNGILVCDVQAHEFEGDEIQNIISGVSMDGKSI